MLQHNKTQFTPNVLLTIKSALLDISKILYRDTVPSFISSAVPPSSTSSLISSEGVSSKETNQPSITASSEGGVIVTENVPIDDVFKTIITPIDTSKTTAHPELYETRVIFNDTKLQITSKPMIIQNKPIGSPYSKEQFNTL